MKKFSKISEGLIGQPMFQLLARVKELEREGREIDRFEIGESTFPTHPSILEATKEALDEGHTRYVNSQGILELREVICDYTKASLGFRPDPEQVMIMPANSVIDAVVRCVVNPGEEVIIPDPGFPTYQAVLNYTGIGRVPVRQHFKGNFFIDLEELEANVTEKTRLIVNNSPSNPTGMMMTKEEIQALYGICESNDLYLLSDEVYSRLNYARPHFSPAVFDECKERTILLNSFSKAYGMSGWRLGYAIGPRRLIQKVTLLFETIYSCSPPFIQHAGITVLREEETILREMRQRFLESRDLLVKLLNEIPGVQCPSPDGAIYVFPEIAGTGLSSDEFAGYVLEKADVALLPGTCFGEFGEGFVRLCFARPPEAIERACRRMKNLFFSKVPHEII